ncbi:recombinase family protein [Niameybacter massiliensis]|uniref:recombinase family protein n=1 Tax=Niameybacter massiliensis TaxID=1658108 RepID=UPI0006B40F2D|nr:recombinase family protein [Niameybacter massiliensis]
MKIAIYSRKSKTSDKGESIDNQIHMCKEYANAHFETPEFSTFVDEGFSGGNTNRPQFKILIDELKKGMYDVLICYRLDRISRNVSDFASTLDILTEHGIGFVSIKENFDTTTPMGRAMIHISSVFAQLERETIAERVTDNLLELAKLGRWLGGTSPLGYKSKKVAYQSSGKTKHYSVLEQDPDTASIVKLIFDKYLELGSISKVETYLMQSNIKTPNKAYFRSNVIRNILINPVYVTADTSIYDYFHKLECILPKPKEEFNGSYGLMPYNRNKKGQGNLQNPHDKWIISIGTHEPIISSLNWIAVQKQLAANSDLAYSNASTSPALLSGLIYCKHCGAPMQVSGKGVLADGTVCYNYRCTTKTKSRGTLCNINNISKGYALDALVIKRIRAMLENETDLIKELKKSKHDLTFKADANEEEKTRIKMELDTNTTTISSLIKKLALFDDPTMEQYIQDEVKALHSKNAALKEQLEDLESLGINQDYSLANIDLILQSLKDFNKLIDYATLHQKKTLMRNLIKRIEWDGETVGIFFYFQQSPL